MSAGCLIWICSAACVGPAPHGLPIVDLCRDNVCAIPVDREHGQYLGHPSTVLLEDGRTLLAVYPKGHGTGALVLKRSDDGGLTWSARLPTPPSWEGSIAAPSLHRIVAPDGTRRLLLFTGSHPIRSSVSTDDGASWTELEPIGDFGGIMTMASVEQLADGTAMALFHDDGRFIGPVDASDPAALQFVVYKTISRDGGLTWSPPVAIVHQPPLHLCEPGLVRSPDGRRMALLLRENSRRANSHIVFSDDEGVTWSAPRALPTALTGDRHQAVYAADGRLVVAFRDMARYSRTYGDWCAWVGTWDDLVRGAEGQYRLRLLRNYKDVDCGYPGLQRLADGTLVAVSYGHWHPGDAPSIACVRFTLAVIDDRSQAR